MSKRHGAREQKRLAKQKAKRASRRKELVLLNSPDPTIRLKAADRWPIVAALVPEDLWETGLGQLVFARRMPGGKLALAVFLLDVFCLGVKNAFWRVMSQGEFDSVVEKIGAHGKLQKVSPEYFSKLVHCTADYAQSLGFPPHRDFHHARLLLEGIDPSQCSDTFEFGLDGKPCYIAGPNESPEQSRAILARVSALGGDFTVPIDPADLPPGVLFDFDQAAQQAIEEGEHDDDSDDERGGAWPRLR